MDKHLENLVESYLIRRVEEAGGLCWKWVSPGRRGVPDRIVIMPGRLLEFVETKATGGSPGPLQRVVHKMLAKLGFKTWLLDTYRKVDEFMTFLKTGDIV